jgi:hypothetical protein
MNGGGIDRCKKYKKWMVVVIDVKNIKNSGGSDRCKKYLKWMVVVIDVKNILNEWL